MQSDTIIGPDSDAEPAGHRRLRAVDASTSAQTWRDVRLPRTPYALFGKRLFDIAVSALLIVALSPVLAVVALALRVRLGPKVVLTQSRVGLHGQTFGMYKFRTMLWSRRTTPVPFEGIDRRSTHKSDDDPRHTELGRALRKTSLDELPQLFNVILGDMSLVGPRPELETVVERFDLRDHQRHAVRPGVTGLWQTSARQDGALLHESVHIDDDYLTNITFIGDMKILLRTFSVVANASGR